MEGGVKRYIVPYAVGFAPALLLLFSWAPDGEWTPFEAFSRNWATPVLGSELFVILVAAREGMLKALPRWNWSRLALAATLILSAIAVLTAWSAPLGERAMNMTIVWFIHGLFGLSIFYLCGRTFQPADLVTAYLAGFAAFAALFFAYLTQIPDWAAFNWKNEFLFFSHIRHLGYYVAAMAALAIGAMAVAQNRQQWLCAWLLAAFGFGAALWTGSRGAAAAVAGALLVGLVLNPLMRSVKSFAGALAAMAVSTIVVWVAPTAPNDLMGLTRTVEATAASDITTGRTTIWKGVIAAIEQRPLFGYGEGQMSKVAPFHDMVQPHNSLLQVTLAWGLAGLACLFVIGVAYCRRALPAVQREGGAVLPAFMAMAALLALSLYDGSLYYPLPQSIFAACAAIIASRWNSAKASLSKAASLAPAE